MAGAETVLADISGPAAREARRPPTALTLVFTDIEGSTRLLRLLGDGYPAALDAHRRLLRALVARHGVERSIPKETAASSSFRALTPR